MKISIEDILSGVHKALAHRIAIMGSAVKFRKTVTFTGGVAQNMGMKLAIEREIGKEIYVPQNPQLVGAYGAALIAYNRS